MTLAQASIVSVVTREGFHYTQPQSGPQHAARHRSQSSLGKECPTGRLILAIVLVFHPLRPGRFSGERRARDIPPLKRREGSGRERLAIDPRLESRVGERMHRG